LTPQKVFADMIRGGEESPCAGGLKNFFDGGILMALKILSADITRLAVDAIVNAANTNLLAGRRELRAA